jgi:hypothetical protein
MAARSDHRAQRVHRLGTLEKREGTVRTNLQAPVAKTAASSASLRVRIYRYNQNALARRPEWDDPFLDPTM